MRFDHLRPFRDLAVIIAFGGWNDAGSAASDTAEHVLDRYERTELGAIDDERYFDYQATRPYMRRSPDGPFIEWPSITLSLVRHPERDILVVVGPEPSLLWRSFSTELVGTLKQLDPTLVVLLGAMLSDTPHSRPLPVSMYTFDSGLRELLNLEPSNYDGPTGIIGVVNQMLITEGLPTASMWVAIPHYVSNPPSPKGQQALLSRLEQVLGLSLDYDDLPDEAVKWSAAVDELSSEDPDVAEYIEQLEEAKDAHDVEGVTGDTIAAEFERYLRGRGDGRSRGRNPRRS
ncbi:MAG: PAC2 family protein [Arachnia sp.]